MSCIFTLGVCIPQASAETDDWQDFYTDSPAFESVPAGTLLREEKLTPRTRRILYSTTLQDGSATYVSGAVLEPTGKWAGADPAPTVVLAPGTRGMADNCAASRGPGFAFQVSPLLSSLGINYELPFYESFTSRGMRLIVTDYVGLGTPGVHSYANRVEQGHAVLDAARAILRADAEAGVSDAITTPLGLFGYSQGGGAAAAGAELAAEYAPELNVRATFAGAPPADLRAMVDSPRLGPVLAYVVAGFAARDREFSNAVNSYLNDVGRFWLAENSHSCIIDSSILWANTPPEALTNSALSMREFVESDPRVSRVLDAQKLGRITPTGAILVSSAPNDDIVPHGQAMQLAADYAALGAPVETLEQPGSFLSSAAAGGHIAGLTAQFGLALDWLEKNLR